MKDINLSVLIPSSLHKEFKKPAVDKGVTMREMMRNFIQRTVDEHHQNQEREQTARTKK